MIAFVLVATPVALLGALAGEQHAFAQSPTLSDQEGVTGKEDGTEQSDSPDYPGEISAIQRRRDHCKRMGKDIRRELGDMKQRLETCKKQNVPSDIGGVQNLKQRLDKTVRKMNIAIDKIKHKVD
jgi:hypothetical protein